MRLEERLHAAIYDNVLCEIAYLSLPEPIKININDKSVLIKYLDMRWEDYRNPFIAKKWGQYTSFKAKLPDGSWIYWDGIDARVSRHKLPEYNHLYMAPRNWIDMAMLLDKDGNVVKRPKRGERWATAPRLATTRI